MNATLSALSTHTALALFALLCFNLFLMQINLWIVHIVYKCTTLYNVYETSYEILSLVWIIIEFEFVSIWMVIIEFNEIEKCRLRNIIHIRFVVLNRIRYIWNLNLYDWHHFILLWNNYSLFIREINVMNHVTSDECPS